jgi:hypothetical protein
MQSRVIPGYAADGVVQIQASACSKADFQRLQGACGTLSVVLATIEIRADVPPVLFIQSSPWNDLRLGIALRKTARVSLDGFAF